MRRVTLQTRCRRITADEASVGPDRSRAAVCTIGYAAFMSFSREDLALLGAAEEVEIETGLPDGPRHRTIIWIVVDGSDVFVRSVRGPGGRWYREVVANADVGLHLDGRRLAARAIPAGDPGSIARTSSALKTKYARDPALAAMLRPNTLDTTIRLEPA